jgi:hypothetical protein
MRSRRASASCSSPVGALCALLALAVAGPAAPAAAKVFHSQREALELAFPEADRIESTTSILSEGQVESIERRARSPVESRIVKLYSGWQADRLLGYAFIDVHTVRTLPEAFMVVLDPDGRVRSLRVLAFHEPLDYLPTERWYEQFDRKTLEEPLRLGSDIHGILGATLSARAVTASVRRALAFYEVLVREGSHARR